MQSKPSKQDSLRMKAEAKLAQITPAESPSRPVADMLHELQVHQIELEMQNEELRRAQIALEESRDHYIDFYDFAPVGYLTLTDKGLIAEINLTGAQLLGVERKQLIQQRLARFATPEERDHIYQCLLTVLKHDEKFSFDTLFKRQDGSNFYAQMDCRRLVKMGEERIVRVVMTDITERKHVESDLRIAAVAFNSQESIMITDAHGVIMRVNQAFTQNTGYTAEEAVGQTLRLLKSGRHNADFYRAMWEELVHTGIWQGEVWDRRKNGEIYPNFLVITAVKGVDGVVTHYVGSHIDITNRKLSEEKIQYLAFYDSLTHLPNRRLLLNRFQQASISSERSGKEGALLFIDLDNFKTLNDTQGHDVGDLLLQKVAQRLESCVREGDTVARLGGTSL